MKIVHVLRRFSFENWGGIEEVVWNLALEQKRAGHDVFIYSTQALSKTEKETVDGIKIHRFSYFYPYAFLSNKSKLALDSKGGNPFSFSLLKEVEKQKFDAVHCHTMGRLKKLLHGVCEKHNISIVSTYHGGGSCITGGEVQSLYTPGVKNMPFGRIIEKIRGIKPVVSERKVLLSSDEMNNEKEDAFFIPNGVSMEIQKKSNICIHQEYNIPLNKEVLLCVSRIDKQKNQLRLLEQLNKIKINRPHLILCGPVTDKIYMNLLKGYIYSNDLENDVTIITNVKPRSPELRALYQQSSCFILPSIHEPFGIVILEAWLNGLPVIANPVGGVKDLLKSGIGGVIDFKKKDSLSKALGSISTLKKRENIEKNINLVKNKYSWSEISNQYMRLYTRQEA